MLVLSNDTHLVLITILLNLEWSVCSVLSTSECLSKLCTYLLSCYILVKTYYEGTTTSKLNAKVQTLNEEWHYRYKDYSTWDNVRHLTLTDKVKLEVCKPILRPAAREWDRALASNDPLDKQTGNEDWAEEWSDDTDNQSSSEALYWTITEDVENNTGDDGSKVTVDNCWVCVRETILDSCRDTLTSTKLLLNTLEDDNVRVNGHTHSKHDTCDTWQSKYCTEWYEYTHKQEYVCNECYSSHPTCALIEQTHIEKHEDKCDNEWHKSRVDRLLTEWWTYYSILDNASWSWNLTRLKNVCKVLSLLNCKVTSNWRVTTFNLVANNWSRVYITIENDSDTLANIVCSKLSPLSDTVRVHSHWNLSISTSLSVCSTSVRDYTTIEWSLTVSTLNLDSVEAEAVVKHRLALDTPLKVDVCWEAVTNLWKSKILVDCSNVCCNSCTKNCATSIVWAKECKKWILLTREAAWSLSCLTCSSNLSGKVSSLSSLSSYGLVCLKSLNSCICTKKRWKKLSTVVSCPELEWCSTLEELTYTLWLLNTWKLNQNAVWVWKALDIWLHNTEVVDTATDDVEWCRDSILSLLAKNLHNLVVRHTWLDILTIWAKENIYQLATVACLSISLCESTDIVTCTLLKSLCCLLNSGNECWIILALTSKRLNNILNLNLKHDVHTALEVKTQVNLLLFALLVSKLCKTNVVNNLVLNRIKVVLLHCNLLLCWESGSVLYSVLLYATSLEREGKLVYTRKRKQDCNQFDKTFTLHLS